MTAKYSGAEAAEMSVALAGLRSGKSHREIAVDLYGADEMAADWHVDSRMRAKVRRLVSRAWTALDDGSPAGRGATPRGTVRR